MNQDSSFPTVQPQATQRAPSPAAQPLDATTRRDSSQAAPEPTTPHDSGERHDWRQSSEEAGTPQDVPGLPAWLQPSTPAEIAVPPLRSLKISFCDVARYGLMAAVALFFFLILVF